MMTTARLDELVAQLPPMLVSDWRETNHFELTNPSGQGEYWWMSFNGFRHLNCDDELGQRVGLIMDIIEELVKIRNPANAHLISAAPDLYTAHVLRDAIDAYKDDKIDFDQVAAVCVKHGWIRKRDEPFYPFQFVRDYTERAMQKARGE